VAFIWSHRSRTAKVKGNSGYLEIALSPSPELNRFPECYSCTYLLPNAEIITIILKKLNDTDNFY
jgi:hypothetical protein